MDLWQPTRAFCATPDSLLNFPTAVHKRQRPVAQPDSNGGSPSIQVVDEGGGNLRLIPRDADPRPGNENGYSRKQKRGEYTVQLRKQKTDAPAAKRARISDEICMKRSNFSKAFNDNKNWGSGESGIVAESSHLRDTNVKYWQGVIWERYPTYTEFQDLLTAAGQMCHRLETVILPPTESSTCGLLAALVVGNHLGGKPFSRKLVERATSPEFIDFVNRALDLPNSEAGLNKDQIEKLVRILSLVDSNFKEEFWYNQNYGTSADIFHY